MTDLEGKLRELASAGCHKYSEVCPHCVTRMEVAEAGRALGRAEGLEEADQIADNYLGCGEKDCDCGTQITWAIRALKENKCEAGK